MLLYYLICIGIISFITAVVFGIDKLRAKERNAFRIPESVLLTLVALGGSVGGLIGLYVFRHKSDFREKFQFGIGLWFSVLVQFALAVFIALVQFGIVSVNL